MLLKTGIGSGSTQLRDASHGSVVIFVTVTGQFHVVECYVPNLIFQRKPRIKSLAGCYPASKLSSQGQQLSPNCKSVNLHCLLILFLFDAYRNSLAFFEGLRTFLLCIILFSLSCGKFHERLRDELNRFSHIRCPECAYSQQGMGSTLLLCNPVRSRKAEKGAKEVI